jgi:tetratricopeptide (TPR) repeat protein
MSSLAQEPRGSRRWAAILVVLFTVALGVGTWLYLQPKPVPKADLIAAAHANARGIGYMEQFNYADAVKQFEEAERLAPEWTPAKINLGIALLNTQVPANLDRAIAIFKKILDDDENNPHAHYCTGIIHFYRGQIAEAKPHFEAVTRIDPNDAFAWYNLATCIPNASDSEEALKLFQKALRINPYLNAARHNVAQHGITAEDIKLKTQLLADFTALRSGNAEDLFAIKYTEMGRYADVIGKSPAPHPVLGLIPMFDPVKTLSVKLADGTAWAFPDKLDDLRKAICTRFGGTTLVLDYNRDGKPDLLLLGAVTRGGELRDLFLRNDGNFTLTDVTAEMGLGNHTASFGGAVGDYDNDGFQDLALAGPTGMQLFRNAAGKLFEDKSAAAGIDKEPGVFLTATWVDLDQDGDLDLVAAKYAQSAELGTKQLKGEKVEGNGRVLTFLNVGEAPPSPPSQPALPLATAFKLAKEPEALLVKGPVTGIVATDVDADLDVDLLVLMDGFAPTTVINDRLLRFHRGENVLDAAAKWNGGFVFDANGDDQSDLILLESGAPPRILLSKRDDPSENLAARFSPGVTDSPPLRSASWVDLDLDGRTDVVGLSVDSKPVFLQGDGAGKFAKKTAPFGLAADSLSDLVGVSVTDLDGDRQSDLLAWTEKGLQAFRGIGNKNHLLDVALTGMRKPVMAGEEGKPLRTNADGVGSWVRLHAGPLRTAAENTTLQAGLGQSRMPLRFGLGKADAVEALRVRWPDAVTQAELNQAAGSVSVVELDRKPSSCPILFTWDGERFAYITDFLGAGSVGEQGPDGSVRPARPEESIKIEPGRLVPRNGKFVLKVGEPMDEIMYLDRLRLDVIDHPTGTSIFPDERFATSDPPPTQERLVFRDSDRIFAVRAMNHMGRDVTPTLRERDGKHVDDFALRSWLGFAETHYVELDFGAKLRSLPAGQKVYLVLAGWTDYAFPESIYAATQAGIPPIWPVLEQKQAGGTWKAIGELGLPAGLTRVMTRDVTGLIDPNGGPVRIRTNLQIFWDQVFLAPVVDIEKSVRELPVSQASLAFRGFAQEYRPGGKLPIAYDYDRLEPVSVTRWRGKVTRSGDVTELLRNDDDRHVVCGPGDEVTVEFDAASLPPLRDGWQRSFVLRSWGYCKDAAPTTLTGGQIGPLPHREMKQFPYDSVKEPLPARLLEYDRVWNTRSPGSR